jgi:hypothetical protein
MARQMRLHAGLDEVTATTAERHFLPFVDSVSDGAKGTSRSHWDRLVVAALSARLRSTVIVFLHPARLYRLRLTNSCSISSLVVMTLLFAWNPR